MKGRVIFLWLSICYLTAVKAEDVSAQAVAPEIDDNLVAERLERRSSKKEKKGSDEHDKTKAEIELEVLQDVRKHRKHRSTSSEVDTEAVDNLAVERLERSALDILPEGEGDDNSASRLKRNDDYQQGRLLVSETEQGDVVIVNDEQPLPWDGSGGDEGSREEIQEKVPKHAEKQHPSGKRRGNYKRDSSSESSSKSSSESSSKSSSESSSKSSSESESESSSESSEEYGGRGESSSEEEEEVHRIKKQYGHPAIERRGSKKNQHGSRVQSTIKNLLRKKLLRNQSRPQHGQVKTRYNHPYRSEAKQYIRYKPAKQRYHESHSGSRGSKDSKRYRYSKGGRRMYG